MMRTIVAILALSPALVFGQTQASAQPRSTPVLESSLLQPVAVAAAVSPVGGADATVTPVRISTGVTAPKRIHTAEVHLENASLRQNFAGDRTVVISMTVDATGVPEHLEVLKSADQATDKAVLTAASQYRYKPGTLNGRPVAVPVELQYSLQ